MKSYTELRAEYGDLSFNTSTANLTEGDKYMNDRYRKILASHAWSFLDRKVEVDTVAATQTTPLPGDMDKLTTLTVTVGTTIYTPRYIPSKKFFNMIASITSFQSDIPTMFTIFAGSMYLWPIPSSSGNTITFLYRRRVKALSSADYTTGTISTADLDDATITGSGTSWNTGMANKYIKIADANTANLGDGIWYEIGSVTDTTHLELFSPYLGTDITAGTATYTIGDVPVLPEGFQDIILWEPLAQYWYAHGDKDLADQYKKRDAEDFAMLMSSFGDETDDVVLDNGNPIDIINPNLVVELQ